MAFHCVTAVYAACDKCGETNPGQEYMLWQSDDRWSHQLTKRLKQSGWHVSVHLDQSTSPEKGVKCVVICPKCLDQIKLQHAINLTVTGEK